MDALTAEVAARYRAAPPPSTTCSQNAEPHEIARKLTIPRGPRMRTAPPLLAEVVRSGFVEGRHRGSVLALAADGSRVLALGDPDAPIFPRSSNKPMQAVGMLEAGLDLDGELLALACASHSGEPFHLDGVRRMLAGAGLDEAALQTPPDWPRRRGRERTRASPPAAGPQPRRHELLGQARRDAGHLRRQRLADRQLPRPGPPAAAAAARRPSSGWPARRSRPSVSTAAGRRCSR